MANETLVYLLEEMAFLYELKDENPFKIKALANSARILSDEADVKELVASGKIQNIPGVGKGTQSLIKEFLEKKSLAELTELRKEFPATIYELTEVPGLGPKKAKALFKELGIASLGELEYACKENRLVELKGFGEKTQSSILASIAKMKANKDKALLPAAQHEFDAIVKHLRDAGVSAPILPVGELRRWMEIVSLLEVLVLAKPGPKIEKALTEWGFTQEGDAWLGRVNLPVKIYFESDDLRAGTRLFQLTGPPEFVKLMGELPSVQDEIELFKKKKRPFLPPEARDLGKFTTGLIEPGDIRGVFHMHTQDSDGANTLEEMVAAAVEMGFEYMGVSEHSKSAFYAHGLSENRVLQQQEEIKKLQKKYPKIKIFHGIESDILSDGSLDYPAKFLPVFDFVIASVHGGMKMNRDDMTKRLCKALENPFTTWLGHWTGRLLLGRDGYDFDVEKVLKVAQQTNTGIELNANPYRLDMDWRILPKAAAHHVPIGIFPDAHSVDGLLDFKYGVYMARKAGLTKDDVINTLPREKMEEWLRARKQA